MRYLQTIILLTFFTVAFAQKKQLPGEVAERWADSVYASLTPEQRIAQLMVVRLSSLDVKNNRVTFYDKQVSELIKNYNIGAICLFQGSPVMQAELINGFQKMAQTPIMVCIDAEWGVGQRFLDSVMMLPKQMMLGAMKEPSLMLQYGKIVAEQCKRIGIHVNYAPVADVNNNPKNPVINDRSFGEDKYKVSAFAIEYMKGMQKNGIMACAKHFPGHGDVVADSHFDLPVINKNRAALDSLELFPFRALFSAGIESAMMAHLFIPAIENRVNMATSLSAKNVTRLLRDDLHFEGLTFTDALDMQAVQKFFPDGESSVESLIAGNDMLCLPADVPQSIAKIKLAINNNRLTWDDIALHCKKVLMAKYHYVRTNTAPIDIKNITADLNANVYAMRKKVAENAITLVANSDKSFFPLQKGKPNEIAYIGMGLLSNNTFSNRMRSDYNATVYFCDYKADSVSMQKLADSILKYHSKIIIGIHNINRRPANNFDITKNALSFIKKIQVLPNMLFVFGNAYASANWCNASNMAVCYEDDEPVHLVAADMLSGTLPFKGTLPVSVCEQYKYGFGIAANEIQKDASLTIKSFYKIDSIVVDAIARKAMPGCVVLIAKDGQIAYEKAFGNYTYANSKPVTENTVYDLASVTKISATTIALMKLYDEQLLDLNKPLSVYLPYLKGTNKEDFIVKDVLLHQAGMAAYIPFYKNTLNKNGQPLPAYYQSHKNSLYSVPVAKNLFLRYDWPSCMMEMIAASPVSNKQYIYSDNDFILLGKLVEKLSGMPLNEYVRTSFYDPMQLSTMGFLPTQRMSISNIAPTEEETFFRSQLLQGTVHDPGAAMFGGVAGHAGLFSNAKDVAAIMQMLLNGGSYNGKKYLSKETVELFSSYNSNISRRGLGFDKPEKDNATLKEPYPCLSASPYTFGHTGYTGIATWADPKNNLLFVFLSNRVYPKGSNLLNKLNVRSKILEEAYSVLTKQ